MHFLLAALPDPMDEVIRHTVVGKGYWFGLTNQMIMAVFAAAIMLAVFPAIFSHADHRAPKGVKNFFESILEFLRVEVFPSGFEGTYRSLCPFSVDIVFLHSVLQSAGTTSTQRNRNAYPWQRNVLVWHCNRFTYHNCRISDLRFCFHSS